MNPKYLSRERIDRAFTDVLHVYLEHTHNRKITFIPPQSIVSSWDSQTGDYQVTTKYGGTISVDDIAFWKHRVLSTQRDEDDYDRRMGLGLRDDAKEIFVVFYSMLAKTGLVEPSLQLSFATGEHRCVGIGVDPRIMETIEKTVESLRVSTDHDDVGQQ